MSTANQEASPELRLIAALRAIVLEAMDFPPARPYDTDSYLPAPLIDQAQGALAAYGAQVVPVLPVKSEAVLVSAAWKPDVQKLQAECDAFNAAHAVGAQVLVKLDGRDEPFATTTRSEAQVLSGHSAVIWLERVVGCYLLDRVTPATRGTA